MNHHEWLQLAVDLRDAQTDPEVVRKPIARRIFDIARECALAECNSYERWHQEKHLCAELYERSALAGCPTWFIHCTCGWHGSYISPQHCANEYADHLRGTI